VKAKAKPKPKTTAKATARRATKAKVSYLSIAMDTAGAQVLSSAV
jgi:hypothetical protein